MFSTFRLKQEYGTEMFHLFHHLDDNFDHDLSGNLDVDLDDSLDLICGDLLLLAMYHTAGSVSIFIQIYMDAPSGVPGVSKEPEGHKDQYLDVFLQ